MKGQVIGKNMTHGYAGDYARQPDMIVDTHPLGGSDAVVLELLWFMTITRMSSHLGFRDRG